MSTGNVILVMGLSSPESGGVLPCISTIWLAVPSPRSSGMRGKAGIVFARGLGTNLYRLGVSPKVIQEILRHADVS